MKSEAAKHGRSLAEQCKAEHQVYIDTPHMPLKVDVATFIQDQNCDEPLSLSHTIYLKLLSAVKIYKLYLSLSVLVIRYILRSPYGYSYTLIPITFLLP